MAIDLETRDHAWSVPDGDTSEGVREHAALQGPSRKDGRGVAGRRSRYRRSPPGQGTP